MNGHDIGLPIEQFIQALTSQLDRAQAALSLKARAGLPLTFAVKDLTLDLRTHVEMTGSVVRIRPAGPGEGEASTLRLQLTTITRPMIEENAVPLSVQPDEPSLREVLGPEVTEDEERRLEWAGIHNVRQLRDLQQRTGEDALGKFTQLPMGRLRTVLARAIWPRIARITPEVPPPAGDANGHPPVATQPEAAGPRPPLINRFPGMFRPEPKPEWVTPVPVSPVDFQGSFKSSTIAPSPSVAAPLEPSSSNEPALPTPSVPAPPAIAVPVAAPPLLRISGVNLVRGMTPRVTIQGEAVPVINATEKEIVVAPHAHLLSGMLAVEVEPGVVAESHFQLPPQSFTPQNGGAR